MARRRHIATPHKIYVLVYLTVSVYLKELEGAVFQLGYRLALAIVFPYFHSVGNKCLVALAIPYGILPEFRACALSKKLHNCFLKYKLFYRNTEFGDTRLQLEIKQVGVLIVTAGKLDGDIRHLGNSLSVIFKRDTLNQDVKP